VAVGARRGRDMIRAMAAVAGSLDRGSRMEATSIALTSASVAVSDSQRISLADGDVAPLLTG
jgi:hypothetical protein